LILKLNFSALVIDYYAISSLDYNGLPYA
jgi:hypothetical protein